LTYPPGTVGASWCLTERGAKDVLVNLAVLQAWGVVGQEVIEGFNRAQISSDKKP
jgi:hypothetical protein